MALTTPLYPAACHISTSLLPVTPYPSACHISVLTSMRMRDPSVLYPDALPARTMPTPAAHPLAEAQHARLIAVARDLGLDIVVRALPPLDQRLDHQHEVVLGQQLEAGEGPAVAPVIGDGVEEILLGVGGLVGEGRGLAELRSC